MLRERLTIVRFLRIQYEFIIYFIENAFIVDIADPVYSWTQS